MAFKVITEEESLEMALTSAIFLEKHGLETVDDKSNRLWDENPDDAAEAMALAKRLIVLMHGMGWTLPINPASARIRETIAKMSDGELERIWEKLHN